MEKKTYITMDPISQAILVLKKSLEDAGHLKEMDLAKSGIDKSFYEVVKAYKLLCEDVDFLHRNNDELEEKLSTQFHDEFFSGYEKAVKENKYTTNRLKRTLELLQESYQHIHQSMAMIEADVVILDIKHGK